MSVICYLRTLTEKKNKTMETLLLIAVTLFAASPGLIFMIDAILKHRNNK